MPEGRTLPYCGKACRRVLQARARASSVRGGLAEALDYFVAFLDRVEKVVASKVGAGDSVVDAWDPDRWIAELAADLPEVDRRLVDAMWRYLVGAQTVADVHAAFDEMRRRMTVVRESAAS